MALRADWTETPPNEPGFYPWHRTEELVKTTVVEVIRISIGLVMQMPGDENLYDLTDFACEWGPKIEINR